MGAIIGKFLLPWIWNFVSDVVVNKFFNGNKRAIVEETGTSPEEQKNGKEERKKEKSPTVEDDQRVPSKFGNFQMHNTKELNFGGINNYNHAKHA